MAEVKQFDEYKAREELKKCPKIVRDYVKLLEKHYEKQKELTRRAMGKLREVARGNTEAIKQAKYEGYAEGQSDAYSSFQDEVSYRGWK